MDHLRKYCWYFPRHFGIPLRILFSFPFCGHNGIWVTWLEHPENGQYFWGTLIQSESIKNSAPFRLIHIAYFRRVDAFPNILATFFIGSRIPDFDSFNEAKIISDCQWLLSQAYMPNVPYAINAFRSNWTTMSNFRGSYSYFSMNSAHHEATAKRLAEPVVGSNDRRRIFFAGEHTSEYFSGYSNGAVETGFRAAEEVLTYSKGMQITSFPSLFLVLILYLF